ncbi:type 1 glutamine amidotransferase domain-containing protein [Allokutzneria sp. NRRL B-24872]|uniref:type 1 glutamine amidotransferase domain-containing protein n=1 Tax=Allokutzneria sp. NRRL B-24872 TaxID=1137961 RepID=UPI000A3A3689|nr:type 1 glutamine amidotransferase domain-containing protein [Allokutzneria sp. NRRL B-24872]
MAEYLKRIAFMVADEGIEQVELTSPWQTVLDAPAEPRLLGPELGEVRGFNHLDPADSFPVDIAFEEAVAADYAGLVLPGGVANADKLRMNPHAVRLVKEFVAAGKPIAAICHAPWVLVEADVVRGKTLTSFPSLTTDIRNAGATWVDEEVFVCDHNGWQLITSRTPEDLDAFNAAILKVFSLGA